MKNKIEIKAEKWVNNGVCIGYRENETYFILGAIPGETVNCEIIKKTSKQKLLKVLKFISPSDLRILSDCEIFLECGGCQFRHINYSEELKIKENLLRTELKWSDNIKIIYNDPTGYRNNVQIKTLNQKLGFYKTGTNDLVILPKTGCKNLHPALNSFLKSLNNISQKKEIKLRIDDSGIKDYSRNETFITIKNFSFQIPALGFFQINRFLIPTWIDQIISLLSEKKSTYLELFSGCGLVSVCISNSISSANCLEIDKQSIEFSKKNSKTNNKNNLIFHQMNLYEPLEKKIDLFLAKHWIANPPRNGLGPEIISLFEKIKPETLIYSSCNYITLSHDLKKLLFTGYKITHLSIFDFFPRTHYFETLVKLEKI